MRPAESFVESPVRSLQTMLRVISEDDPHLPSLIPDGIYADTTETAVAAFQRQYGLPPTGITDQTTWEKIVEIYEAATIRVGKAQPIEIILDANKIFRYGDNGPYIYLLQSILIQLSEEYSTISQPKHSGTFDSNTVDALKEFQVLADLPVTGELDKVTWKALALQYALYTHNFYRKNNNVNVN